MIDSETTVIAHAGREETRFCITNIGQRPIKLWDVQIAEGLRGNSYPLSYERLISRVIGKHLTSSETRTDWQRRPLTERQIEYALDDVRYLLKVHERQSEDLQSQGRLSWATEETERMIDDMVSERQDETWRKLSGVRRLNRRQLAVVRELFRWRASEGEERDQPARRVLRDDLVIDLARRQPQSESELMRSRDMNRSNYRRNAPAMVECVKAALAIPDNELPEKFRKEDSGTDEPVLGKLLALTLANRCEQLNVSAGLVGTSADLKELIRWHVKGCPEKSRPLLETGWRAEVCGDLLRQVLEGRISLRVSNATSKHPLVFEPVEPDA
jgi:ribonuclease D